MNNATQQCQQWQDDDVIGLPGQHLTPEEIAHLVALANGNTPSQITIMHGTSRGTQRDIESSLKAKLGALSKPHLVTRAFVLRVIAPRALMVLLAIATLGATHNPDAIAQRAPRRPQSSVSVARLVRTNRSSGNAA